MHDVDGVQLLMDPMTHTLSQDQVIDYVDTPQGSGFKIGAASGCC